ncbi:MAG: hypothetical protein ACFB9M_00495 [Myxococcota bacterium]
MTTRTVSTVYGDAETANRAVEALLQAGHPPEAISLLTDSDTKETLFPGDRQEVEKGTGWGALFGALIGSGVMISLLPIPGGIFVSGPLGAILTATATGALGGGLIGSLVGLGVPREKAMLYERRLREGGVAVAVDTETKDEADEADALLCRVGSAASRQTLVVTKPRP